MKKLFILALLALITKCDFVPQAEIYRPDYTPQISVFGIISNDENYEFVVVERTLRLNEADESEESIDVVDPIIKDAIVKIICDVDTVQFKFYKKPGNSTGDNSQLNYYQKGIYLDRDDEFHAQSGKTYKLLVEVPGKGTVTGTTTVPFTPQISTPAPMTILNKKTLKQTKVSWEENSQTAAYILSFIMERKPESPYPYNRFDTIEDNIVYESPATLKNIDNYYLYSSNQYLDTGTIKLSALDRNIYDYSKKSSLASITGAELFLVQGGVGVFGSICVDSVNVIWK